MSQNPQYLCTFRPTHFPGGERPLRNCPCPLIHTYTHTHTSILMASFSPHSIFIIVSLILNFLSFFNTILYFTLGGRKETNRGSCWKLTFSSTCFLRVRIYPGHSRLFNSANFFPVRNFLGDLFIFFPPTPEVRRKSGVLLAPVTLPSIGQHKWEGKHSLENVNIGTRWERDCKVNRPSREFSTQLKPRLNNYRPGIIAK